MKQVSFVKTSLRLSLCLCLLCAVARAQATGGTPAAAPAASPTEQPSSVAVPSAAVVNNNDETKTNTMTAPSAKPAAAAVAAAVKAGAVVLPPEKVAPVSLPRFDQAPVIDGKLDDAVWQHAARFADFYQVRPGDNLAPSQASEALIGYDAKFLYLAFRAHDEPGKVRVTVAKRDDIFNDDYIGVSLDTFNDQRKAFEFFFNPLGVQADAIRTEGSGEDFSVDFVHESKGIVTDDGYTVEVAIPFKSLRYEAGKGKLWGLHVFRSIKRFNDELDSWMPLSRERTGTLNQQGHITGLENISTERTLELIPSLTVSETGKRVRAVPPTPFPGLSPVFDPGRSVNRPVEFDPGLTVKFGITPTITLDAAINPDFAQVEADETVVTVNQRFPIFFEEKRPFFLEGKDVFQTPITAVHTRAIIDPDYAVKLTGKRGRNTFGLILASDNAPGNFSQDDRDEAQFQFLQTGNRARLRQIEKFGDKNSYIGVLRLKRDFGQENTLGLLATTYSFIERHNHLGGFDGRFRLDPKTVLSFQLLGTTSRRFFFDTEAGRNLYRNGNAFAYRLNLDHGGRHFGYFFNGEGYTRDYRADVGFTTRTNTNNFRFAPRWNSEPKPKARIVSYRANVQAVASLDWQGRSQRLEVQPIFGLNLQRQTYLTFGYRRAYERLLEEEFGAKRTATRPVGAFFGPDSERSTRKQSLIAVIETTPSKKYSLFAQIVRDYHVFDFDFGAGTRFPRVSPAALADPNAPLDPGAGNLWNIQTSLTLQPRDALRTSLDYTKQRLVRGDTRRVAFDENIITSRTTYQFTRFMFARARVDYSTLSSSLRAQFLVGYTPNPGTAFYAGYNDDLARNGFNPFNGQLEPGFRRNGRTFFIKAAYLFRRSFGS